MSNYIEYDDKIAFHPGYYIKEIVEESGLTQEDFAKEIGVSFATVNRWETGKAKPNLKTMKLIDDYCKKNAIDFDVSEEIID